MAKKIGLTGFTVFLLLEIYQIFVVYRAGGDIETMQPDFVITICINALLSAALGTAVALEMDDIIKERGVIEFATLVLQGGTLVMIAIYVMSYKMTPIIITMCALLLIVIIQIHRKEMQLVVAICLWMVSLCGLLFYLPQIGVVGTW